MQQIILTTQESAVRTRHRPGDSRGSQHLSFVDMMRTYVHRSNPTNPTARLDPEGVGAPARFEPGVVWLRFDAHGRFSRSDALWFSSPDEGIDRFPLGSFDPTHDPLGLLDHEILEFRRDHLGIEEYRRILRPTHAVR